MQLLPSIFPNKQRILLSNSLILSCESKRNHNLTLNDLNMPENENFIEVFRGFVIVTCLCVGISQSLAYFVSKERNKLSYVALLSLVVQWLFYLIHGSGIVLGNKPTEMLYDLSGALTFYSCTIYSIIKFGGFSRLYTRQRLLSGFVIIWCARLGSYLFYRIMKDNCHDSRFDSIRSSFFRFFNFWTIQSLWV